MTRIISKYKKVALGLTLSLSLGLTSCSDGFMDEVNTNETKSTKVDPNTQLTTSLLQTYGDFGMMDTYRSYITGFTQHFAGGWNVTNYAGSVHYKDDQASQIWDRLYSISIKNLNDAILNSKEGSAVNAALRIHKAYLMAVLTDIYGDVPCFEAGYVGLKEGATATPKYDRQEEIYNWILDELKACREQLEGSEETISGDVTSLKGEPYQWMCYANSLIMRYAMRISDVNPQKAQEVFEETTQWPWIDSAEDDAYIIYLDKPFTLYEGSRENDFRSNALSAVLYGQDPTSPTFVCSTLFDMMNNGSVADPRLYAISRHYINVKRSEIKPDIAGNVDVTDEVLSYLNGNAEKPCQPGAAWWNNWLQAPANSAIPTLERLVKQDPDAGYDQSNYPARMMRPALSIYFEMPDAPGILMTSAEVSFLLAEAKSKGWKVYNDVRESLEEGIKASMELLNKHYLPAEQRIDSRLVSDYIAAFIGKKDLSNPEVARELINTQAWILHMTNPNEGWANLRRADYPVIADRTKLGKDPSSFTYDDADLTTPTRLPYPQLESKYNTDNYNEAIERLGGRDNWHKRVWWDVKDINVK